jgi:hypothetical protein
MSPLRYRNPMHGFQIFVHRMVKTSNSAPLPQEGPLSAH